MQGKILTIDKEYGIITEHDKDLGLFFVCKNPESILKKVSGGSEMRVKITLACTECKQRNYNMMKEKKNHPERMETKKYCRFCKTHTMHRETK